jgi:ribosomal protein S18 acetylase RimI-like enzyme
VVVKHDEGVSGLGNGRLDLRGVDRVEDCLDAIELEAADASPADFYDRLEREGGVVEVFLEGRAVTSPSAQVRVPPGGPSEVLSTHEQVVGGRHGLTYEGCVMPASGRYAAMLAEHAARVGAVLTEEGVVGRFAIDFLVVDDGPEPEVFGLEINLRNGGTTHPLNTLAALCGGGYDPAAGHYVTGSGNVRSYRATDHLIDERYTALTTDELLDLVVAEGLAWDDTAQTGVLVHMASGIAGMGVVGVTAVAPTPAEAGASYERVRRALDRAAAAHRPVALGIVPYASHHRADFERLNREWVERWFTLEPVDLMVLTDPEQHLIAGGGQVLLAVTPDGTAVGTAALRHEGDGVYELTKMSVTPDLRGAGIGRQLAEAAIAAYVEAGGRELFLETNARLGPAIALYESLGFEHRPLRPGSHYDRADVHMVWVPPAT